MYELMYHITCVVIVRKSKRSLVTDQAALEHKKTGKLQEEFLEIRTLSIPEIYDVDVLGICGVVTRQNHVC